MKFKEEYEDICKAGFVGSYEDYLDYRRGYGKEVDEEYKSISPKEQRGNITVEQLTDTLLSSDYFIYKLVEELKKRGELK